MKIAPFVVDYWKRFARHVYVYDNYSDDGVAEFLEKYDWITVKKYNSNNQLNDLAYLNIKNNCWKGSDADWVWVSDFDECPYTDDLSGVLDKANNEGLTLIRPKWIDLFSETEFPSYTEGKLLHEVVNYGVKNPNSKVLMFKPSKIQEINYGVGAHSIKAVGEVKEGRLLNVFHCKNLGLEYVKERNVTYQKRMSDINKEKKWGYHYFLNDDNLRSNFESLKKNRKLVSDLLKHREPKIKTYITYFDDRQIEEYNLKADENTVLFKGNDTSYSGESINHLNTFYCELCTFYYVWKNNLRSDYVCFKQYRRLFDWNEYRDLPRKGEVVCYEPLIIPVNIAAQFCNCHGRKRAIDLIGYMMERFGKDSDVVRYFTRSNLMYTNNSVVLNWEDFCDLCEFVFGVLDGFDKHYKLGYDYKKYEKNARQYTEDGRFGYQMHWVAYIGERLVSCYIKTKLKPITIPRLKNNGFFQPYKPKESKDENKNKKPKINKQKKRN